MRRCSAAASALLLTLSWATPARAGDEAALKHFEEGRHLARVERWQEAADAFRASLAVEPSVGGHLNLGNAYAKLGKVASAVDQFRSAERLAGPADPERAKEARTRREALAKSVPTVTVTAGAEATISIDAQRARSGVAVEVDPGLHVVAVTDASRSGTPRTIDVDVHPGDHAKVVVAPNDERPQLSVEGGAPGGAEAGAPAASSADSPLPTLGWIGIGAGAAALAVSGVFYGLAVSDKGDLESTCPAYPRCRNDEIDAARSLDDSAHTKTTIATIGLASGLGLLVTGAVLLFVAPPRTARGERRDAPVAFSVGPWRQGAGALVRW